MPASAARQLRRLRADTNYNNLDRTDRPMHYQTNEVSIGLMSVLGRFERSVGAECDRKLSRIHFFHHHSRIKSQMKGIQCLIIMRSVLQKTNNDLQSISISNKQLPLKRFHRKSHNIEGSVQVIATIS